MEKLIVGIDESGTGAFCGPFTVCAFAVPARHAAEVVMAGAKDSKALSDAKRRTTCEWLAVVQGALVDIQVVPAEKTMPQRKAWREAVAQAAISVIGRGGTQNVELFIDGKEDFVLSGYFQRQWGVTPNFVIHGDSTVPVIGAASIFAKTERNDLMLELAKRYPLYGFEEHYGYGTEAHLEAIAVHGVCPAHRKISALAHYFGISPDSIQEEP